VIGIRGLKAPEEIRATMERLEAMRDARRSNPTKPID
jgi:hypothetical protein